MKKVLISESQLRAMVRKMLIEQTTMGSTPVGSTGFAPQSNLSTTALKQSTTTQSEKNKQQQTTLSNVKNINQLNGQFLNLMKGVNQNTLGTAKITKQTLIQNFGKLLTDLGYK